MKARRSVKPVLIILLTLCIAGTVFFSASIWSEQKNLRQAAAYHAALPTVSPIRRERLPRASLVPLQDSKNAQPASEANTDDIEWIWTPIIDFDAFRIENPDTIGWVLLENTVINYPIVIGRDNDYYLRRLPNGESNKLGSIFMDYRNAPDFSDKITLIYGHNVNSGEMFTVLNDYENSAFYRDHPTVMIFTPEQDFEIELIAGYKLNSARETPPLGFKDEAEFLDYIQHIKSRSVFTSSVEVEGDDRIVCLCTCNYSLDNGRMIIVGKLVAAG